MSLTIIKDAIDESGARTAHVEVQSAYYHADKGAVAFLAVDHVVAWLTLEQARAARDTLTEILERDAKTPPADEDDVSRADTLREARAILDPDGIFPVSAADLIAVADHLYE